MTTQCLPAAAPARVLAVGAWLKNTACLLDGDRVHWSPLHGDLATPHACLALEASIDVLLATAGGRIDAVAHDLHPDFESTRLAQALAARLGVPAVPVQHHHAHVGVVQAESGSTSPVIGLALDGVGLGTDGTAWGGELLSVAGARWSRVDHLTPLRLPGGDVAAREPWRMGASALHLLGRGEEIVPRFAPVVGERLAAGVAMMLERGLNCPGTTGAGRWFDAIAGLLGLSVRQAAEAEAAIALERAAARWLDGGRSTFVGQSHAAAESVDVAAAEDAIDRSTGLDLRPLLTHLLRIVDPAEAAARFHLGLARILAREAIAAAEREGTATVVLAGGCFHNTLLTGAIVTALEEAGLDARRPQGPGGPGDAGLALGQAWIAAQTITMPHPHRLEEEPSCA